MKPNRSCFSHLQPGHRECTDGQTFLPDHCKVYPTLHKALNKIQDWRIEESSIGKPCDSQERTQENFGDIEGDICMQRNIWAWLERIRWIGYRSRQYLPSILLSIAEIATAATKSEDNWKWLYLYHVSPTIIWQGNTIHYMKKTPRALQCKIWTCMTKRENGDPSLIPDRRPTKQRSWSWMTTLIFIVVGKIQ